MAAFSGPEDDLIGPRNPAMPARYTRAGIVVCGPRLQATPSGGSWLPFSAASLVTTSSSSPILVTVNRKRSTSGGSNSTVRPGVRLARRASSAIPEESMNVRWRASTSARAPAASASATASVNSVSRATSTSPLGPTRVRSGSSRACTEPRSGLDPPSPLRISPTGSLQDVRAVEIWVVRPQDYLAVLKELAIDPTIEPIEPAGPPHRPRTAREEAAAAVLDSDLAVSVWDRAGDGFIPVWLNEAFTRLTGYTLDHAGTTWESLLPEDAGASVLELLDTHRPQDPPVQMSVPIINTAGEELTVPVAITPQYDDDGVVGGFVAAQRQSAHVTTSVRETSAAANTPLLVEHQSRRSLELVAKVSELLAEIDEDQLLVAIARLVARRDRKSVV